jgi:hypothetical protein
MKCFDSLEFERDGEVDTWVKNNFSTFKCKKFQQNFQKQAQNKIAPFYSP